MSFGDSRIERVRGRLAILSMLKRERERARERERGRERGKERERDYVTLFPPNIS